MLVLAMEFSRGAQRVLRATDIKEQTDERVRCARASGRHCATGAGRHRVEGRNRPGLLDEQGPRVTPSKRNSDAHFHPQGPQASRAGHPKM